MTTRPNITVRMKIDSLLQRVFVQFGSYLKDPTGFEETHMGGNR